MFSGDRSVGSMSVHVFWVNNRLVVFGGDEARLGCGVGCWWMIWEGSVAVGKMSSIERMSVGGIVELVNCDS